LLAGILVALSTAGPALASACGDKVLDDWYDNGRIDRLYPPHCYEEAIDSIPSDIGPYIDAEEVITRALQASLSGKLAQGGVDPTPGKGDDGDDPRTPGTPSNPTDPGEPTDPSGGGNSEATPDVDTSGPSSIPIPLLVLGGMSVALLAAGGIGYLSRRRSAALNGDEPQGSDDDPFAL
jgi:hypothetical protein